MAKEEVPEFKVEDFYAGLEKIDEGTKQHILGHVHDSAIMRMRREREAAATALEAPQELLTPEARSDN